jgi:chromosome partitioning protein
MIIVLANQKGGVGKSTHCALFAHYLCEKGKKVQVFDMDFQKTLERMRANDESVYETREKEQSEFDNPLYYEVEYLPDEEILSVLKDADRNKEKIYLFDAPGNLSRSNVLKLLSKADFIITPFQYETVVLDSTVIFVQICDKFKFKAKIIFLPTNVDARVKRDSAAEIDEALNKIGYVAPIVFRRENFKQFSTIEISNVQREVTQAAYDFMFSAIFG